MRIHIESVGFAVPDRIQTSDELSPLVGRSPQWIARRTGVLQRRIAEESIEVLGARAARDALGDGVPPDLVINASTTTRQLLPDSSVFLCSALGYSGIPSFSIHATCLSFLVAVRTAAALVSTGAHRRVLVVSSECGTVSRNFEEKESAALIGDGAGAALVVSTPTGQNSEMLAYVMRTYPEGAHLTEVRGFGTHCHPNASATVRQDNLFSMDGPGVYRMARRRMGELLDELFAGAALSRDDVDVLVPHQASGPALASLPRYGFPSSKVIDVVGEYGNCIAASIPMALALAVRQGRIRRGNLVLILGTGAGLSVAGALFRW